MYKKPLPKSGYNFDFIVIKDGVAYMWQSWRKLGKDFNPPPLTVHPLFHENKNLLKVEYPHATIMLWDDSRLSKERKSRVLSLLEGVTAFADKWHLVPHAIRIQTYPLMVAYDDVLNMARQMYPDMKRDQAVERVLRLFSETSNPITPVAYKLLVCPNCKAWRGIKAGNTMCDKCVAEMYDEEK